MFFNSTKIVLILTFNLKTTISSNNFEKRSIKLSLVFVEKIINLISLTNTNVKHTNKNLLNKDLQINKMVTTKITKVTYGTAKYSNYFKIFFQLNFEVLSIN